LPRLSSLQCKATGWPRAQPNSNPPQSSTTDRNHVLDAPRPHPSGCKSTFPLHHTLRPSPTPANPATHQQSHSLWYTSSRNPALSHSFLNPSSDTLDNDNNNLNGPRTTTNPTPTNPGNHPTQNTPAPNPATTSRQNQGGGGGPNNPNTNQSPSTAAQIIDRSLLGRLHAEELLLERRRAAVTNLGSTWLKPPGLAKTLFQMREERREAEEHAEAMRREMLAQELAEAEAEAAAAAAGGGGGGLPQPALQGVEGE
jgi:hypothetical protein